MKKLCFDARMINHSGIGTYIRNILMRFQDFPHEVSVIVGPEAAAEHAFLRAFKLIETSAPIYSIEEQLKLPFLIPRCDLFWSMHYNVPLMPIRARTRMVTIHDVNHLALRGTLPQSIYAKMVLKAAASRSKHILTISQFSKGEIERFLGVSQGKVTAIHLGVDRAHFYPRGNEELRVRVREKYALPEKFILFVSNLAPHKNVRGLLVAWQKLELPGWQLVFVGREGRRSDWEDVSRERVVFLGKVDYNDLPLIYESAYASILPSFYEGFGLTPLESMSCGCPVIVSNAASLPEVCGASCIYVDPYSPEDIARGLKAMIADTALRERLKVAGLERALQFDWDRTARAHREIIESL
jgi:glycosyltransferase involved in cell wall biosynthesis